MYTVSFEVPSESGWNGKTPSTDCIICPKHRASSEVLELGDVTSTKYRCELRQVAGYEPITYQPYTLSHKAKFIQLAFYLDDISIF